MDSATPAPDHTAVLNHIAHTADLGLVVLVVFCGIALLIGGVALVRWMRP